MRRTTAAFLVLVASIAGVHRAGSAERERVFFSALDKAEKPVLGLTGKDFELRADGQPADMPELRGGAGRSDRSVPAAVSILLDFSPGVDTRMIEAQSGSADGIFDLFHPDSAIGVQLVSDRLETLAPIAHSSAAVRDAFRQFGRRRTELRVGGTGERLGSGGLMRALAIVARELSDFAENDPSLKGREVRKAILIISDGNVNPEVKRTPVFDTVALERVFLYPVFVPRARYGPWLTEYFDLARKTAGVSSVIGALAPGSDILRLPRANLGRNALSFNFMHLARDLNGKYSFDRPPDARRISLKCRRKDVQVRLPLD
jgi:hypothetical protein